MESVGVYKESCHDPWNSPIFKEGKNEKMNLKQIKILEALCSRYCLILKTQKWLIGKTEISINKGH